MDASPVPEPEDTCSFCGKSRSHAEFLIGGTGGAFICADCVWRLFREHVSPKAQPPVAPSGPPPGHPSRMRGESSTSRSFDRFTERARTVLALAQAEAQRFNHHYIGTAHLT